MIPGHGKFGGADPYAFTEQGVAILSSVLRSTRAVQVSIAIMRTFAQFRRLMDSNRDLARQIDSLEKKYEQQFRVVFDAIKRLVAEGSFLPSFIFPHAAACGCSPGAVKEL